MTRPDKARSEVTNLNQDQLLYLRDILEERTGLYHADDRLEDLAAAFGAVLGELPDGNALVLWRQLTSGNRPSHPNFDRFVSHFTVGETYFFRYAPDFSALREHILPDLIKRRASTSRELRMWSAACSTGEEPYSLAILVKDLVGDLSDWRVHILGTDIDFQALQTANQGVYGRWSFRGVPEEIQSRCFTKSENTYVLNPEFRQMVTFKQLNLLDRGWPSRETDTERMDLVLCRNVLIYFRLPTIVDISNRIFDALASDGILMVSHTEHGSDLHPRFQRVILPETIIYGKQCPKPLEDGSAKVNEVLLGGPPAHPPLSVGGGGPEGVQTEAEAVSSMAAGGLDLEKLMSEAEAYFAAKNYDGAVRCLSGCNSPVLGHFEACLLVARSYANLGLLVEGVEWCSRAVKLNPLNAESRHLLALLEINTGQTPEAIDDLRKAIFLDPDLAIAYFELGNCLKGTGQRQQAVKAYESSILLLAGKSEAETVPFSDGLVVGQLRRALQRSLQMCRSIRE